jgi:hypothetical protein
MSGTVEILQIRGPLAVRDDAEHGVKGVVEVAKVLLHAEPAERRKLSQWRLSKTGPSLTTPERRLGPPNAVLPAGPAQ